MSSMFNRTRGANDSHPTHHVSAPPFEQSGDVSKASANHDESAATPEPPAVIVDQDGMTWLEEMDAGKCDGPQPSHGQSRPSEVVSDPHCPITNYIMTDPVRADDGITYERNNIVAWFKEHGAVSPMVKEKDGSRKRIGTSLIADLSRRSAIESLQVPIKLSPTGASSSMSVTPMAACPHKLDECTPPPPAPFTLLADGSFGVSIDGWTNDTPVEVEIVGHNDTEAWYRRSYTTVTPDGTASSSQRAGPPSWSPTALCRSPTPS